MAWNEPGGDNKDPWGHRKNEQGPPDLDEVIKNLQEKFNKWFGGGGKPSGAGGGGATMDFNWQIIGIIAAIILFIWSLFGFYVIQPAEQGVETRFGSYVETTSQGLNWHIPYPIEHVEKINVDQVRAITHKASMLTRDENIIDIEVIVQYRVNDARNYLFNVRNPDDTLHQATESALREIVGGSKMDDVLTSERARIATDTRTRVQEILNSYEAGLIVTSVNMQGAQPPAEVQESFADVIKAREDEERSKNKAEAYSNEIVQRAGGSADRLRQEAQAYKAQVIARAEGETKRFLSILQEYEKAPDITRQRLYLEMMESVLSNTSKVMMNVQNAGNSLMYLPLDRLMSSTNVQTATPTLSASPSTVTQTNPSANEDIRSRDNARYRGAR